MSLKRRLERLERRAGGGGSNRPPQGYKLVNVPMLDLDTEGPATVYETIARRPGAPDLHLDLSGRWVEARPLTLAFERS